MGGVFTREERAVVVFLVVSILVGSLVLAARRVRPEFAPELDPTYDVGSAQPQTETVRVGPVDIRSGSLEELMALPGIGPKKAEAIIRFREERGGISAFEDLLEVRGIGPKTLEQIRSEAVLGPPAAGERLDRATTPGDSGT